MPSRSRARASSPQPALPRATARRGTCFSTTSRPAKKKRKTSPRVSREAEIRVDPRPAEHLRADQDPEHDLDHDGRQDDAAVEAREERADARRGEHEHERVEIGRCGQRRKGERDHRSVSLLGRHPSSDHPEVRGDDVDFPRRGQETERPADPGVGPTGMGFSRRSEPTRDGRVDA